MRTLGLSLMISLLTCTQTYKNNTALVSPHRRTTTSQCYKRSKTNKTTTKKKHKNTNPKKQHTHDGTSESLVSSSLEMKQKPETTRSTETQHFFISNSFIYTNLAPGSLWRHKCYDSGTPDNHITVQFFCFVLIIMLQ